MLIRCGVAAGTITLACSTRSRAALAMVCGRYVATALVTMRRLTVSNGNIGFAFRYTAQARITRCFFHQQAADSID